MKPASAKRPRVSTVVPRGHRATLRLRLFLWMIVMFSLIIFTMLGVFCLYERAAIRQRMHAELEAWTMEIATEISETLPRITDAELEEIRRRRLAVFPFQLLYIDIFDDRGRRIARSSDTDLSWDSIGLAEIPAASSPLVLTRPLELLPQPVPYAAFTKITVVGIGAPDGSRLAVTLTTSDAFIRRRFALLMQVAAASGVMSVLAAAATGWFIAGVAVAPFERLRELVRQVEPGTPHPAPPSSSSALEVHKLTEELENARRRIDDRFAAQERFLSNVSHELNTPIAVMLVETQTLNTAQGSPELSRYTTSMRDELLRLGRLVESFLTLTRMRDNKAPPRIMACGANDLVMDSLEHCSRMAEQHRVMLSPVLLADESSVDAAICGDPDLLRTMVDNLVRNAIRFSPECGRVQVVLECDALRIRISVRDDGPGIPPDKLDAIFNRFAQAHGGTRYQRGHGLGLFIAQGIAELHGGLIAVANREGGGCEFTVSLPRYAESASSPEPHHQSHDAHPNVRRNPDDAQPTNDGSEGNTARDSGA